MLGDDDYRALAAFRFQLRRFLAFSEGVAKASGLEPQHHQLLLATRAAVEPPTIGELAERLVLKHHSTVELVTRLARRDLVKRVRSADDRRVVRVHITPRGERVLAKLTRAHHDELRRAGPDLVRALENVLGGARARPSAKKAARSGR